MNTDALITLITGASRGIGRACALMLAEQGHELILVARDDNRLRELNEDCKRVGAKAHYFVADLSDSHTVVELFKDIQRVLANRPLSNLIHCAGQMRDAMLSMTRVNDIESLLAVNVVASIQVCQLASRLMMRYKTGHLLLVSSKVAEYGSAGQSVYAATKGAIPSFVKSLSKEMGPLGIRVNAISPGFIETDLTAHYTQEQKQQLKESISLRRLGQAEDVASVAKFLCSKEAAYVTGHIMSVDGGLSL